MRDNIISLVVLIVFFLVGAWFGNYYSTKSVDVNNVIAMDSSIGVKDLGVLIERARLSKQLYLRSILLAVRGAMYANDLEELVIYTATYSKQSIEKHQDFKVKKSKI